MVTKTLILTLILTKLFYGAVTCTSRLDPLKKVPLKCMAFACRQSIPNHNPNADSDQTLIPPLLCVYQSTEIAGKLMLYSSCVA